MKAYLQSVATYLGYPELVLEIDERSRKRLLRLSYLPALVFSVALAGVSLEIQFGGGGFATMPEFWERIWLATRVFQSPFLPLALAVLFAAGLKAWGRAEASWLFVIGVALAHIAAGLGLFSVLAFLILGSEDAQFLEADIWAFLAGVPGFLSIGYLFVAYRSAAHLQENRASDTATIPDEGSPRSS